MKKYVLGPNAARKLKALLAKSDGVSRRPLMPSGVAYDLEYAAPFTVKWAASANDGEGAWIIWLPGDGLLVLRGEKIDLAADLEAAGGDYPDGWYVLGDDVLSGESGGDLYLKISLAEDESSEGDDADDADEESVAAFVGEDDGDDDSESLCIAVASCEVDSENGSRLVRQFVDSALVIGDMSTMIAGDSESSEWVKVSGKKLVIQGYPGSGDGADEVDNCGLVFTTVGPRVDDDGNAIPAKIFVGVKDKLSSENWAAKTMTVRLPGGGTKIVHFLGCDDVELYGTDEDHPDPGDDEECERVVSLTGDAYQSATLQGAVAVKGATGSGLEIKTTVNQNAQQGAKNPGGEMVVDLKGRADLSGCGKNFGLHQIKYKDANGNVQIFHGLFCGDIDLTNIGKLIRSTSVTALSNGTQMKFLYTDGSSDTFVIQNGLQGRPGRDGIDGEAPEITSSKSNGITQIFADGELIASIMDGSSPVITASKAGKITTIFSNGVAIATINDGADGSGGDEYVRKQFIDGIRFEMSGGKLKAILSKTEVSVPNWDGVRYVEYEDAQTLEICDVKEVEVVSSESYSTSSHQFTNVRRKITVLGDVAATGQTPFTATPLSGE